MVIEGPSQPFTLNNLQAGGSYLVETFVETILSDQTEATMNNFTLGISTLLLYKLLYNIVRHETKENSLGSFHILNVLFYLFFEKETVLKKNISIYGCSLHAKRLVEKCSHTVFPISILSVSSLYILSVFWYLIQEVGIKSNKWILRPFCVK